MCTNIDDNKTSDCIEKNRIVIENKTEKKTLVSFSEDALTTLNEIPSRKDYTKEEFNQIWYSSREYTQFKFEAQVRAAIIREHRDSFVLGINESYAIAEEVAAAHLDEDETDLSSTLSKIDLSRPGLAEWCIKYDFRGLEKYVSLGIQGRRERLKAGIYRLAFDSKFLVPSRVSKQYQDLSRATRVFARMIGQADFLAAVALHQEP